MLRALGGGDPEAANPPTWTPVSAESTGRRLSAPAPWLCGVTDTGKLRERNEDGYFLSADGKTWIVADGMGGHAAGELASTLTIHAIANALDGAGAGAPASVSMNPVHSLIGAFADAQARVVGLGQNDTRYRGMGSTAIAGVVHKEALHVCHVGDTRGYHLSQGRLRRLTNDHSLVGSLVVAGLITPDQARVHPQRGRITRAIGMPTGFEPDVTSLPLATGDRVLLCSDGLWEALADHDIGAIAGSRGSMLELASVLVDRANSAGGLDNITVVLYEHGAGQVDTLRQEAK
jgi:protein phosphatase